MTKDDMKVIRITTNAPSLKVFEATCIKQHDCKKALECGTFRSVLPVKQDMTGVTENLENESFIGDQDTRVTDDEDIEDQEDLEGDGGDKRYRGEIAWAR